MQLKINLIIRGEDSSLKIIQKNKKTSLISVIENQTGNRKGYYVL
ncbi:MAG: hypothetical protein PHY63_02900 [Candidatus Cloacimonetes bacterium]|nr:hypothetical protein [Candidatus Cloacimonadota bacterium]